MIQPYLKSDPSILKNDPKVYELEIIKNAAN